jgi:prepilin-type N-terminal cleavage/methylation domain-containing protein
MRWPARFRSDESGFTLVELMVSMVIVTLLIGAIGSALIVSLRTTDVTNKRMSESHDVQIISTYLANDVQGAKTIDEDPSSTTCAVTGSMATLITFNIFDAADHTGNTTIPAVYRCGTAANGETQVTRTFANQAPIVIAHFAGTARPTVTVTFDPAHPTIPVSVTMTFTKASDCTLDCTYTLFGSRRSFNTSTAGGVGSAPGDVVLLSTGTSSPLWVQGSCPDPGTLAGCIIDPTKTALPISDVQASGWLPSPLSNVLNDQNIATAVTSAQGSNAEARVLLANVDPPDPGVDPTLEIHASLPAVNGTGAHRITLSIYDGTTRLWTADIGPINQSKSYDVQVPASSITPSSAYAHLSVGFAVSSARANNAQSVSVDGIAFDTLDVNSAGLLTIKGPLYVNSQLSSAVRLTGTKNATKISILSTGPNKGDFQIWNPGACSGCNHTTVACADCTWVGQQPWTNYTQSLPDPLRALPAPDPATLGTGSCNGGGVCQPGVYSSTFSRTSNTTLNPGIYYLQHGMSITGSAALTCVSPCTGGVMLYIGNASDSSVTFAGSSSVNLPALNSKVFAGGLYDGIAMFQARTNTNPVKIAGNSGSGTTNVFGGIVYVPNSSQVTLATGSASLTAKAIVAQNIKVSSSVTIG